MASLVLLSKVPEILFQIINHLSRKDVLSLLQTCRALYPACYRNIWSSVVFNTNTNDDDSYKLIQQARIIKKYIQNATAFRFTRTLVLGPPVFTLDLTDYIYDYVLSFELDPGSKNYVDLPEVLQELVESNGLDLRRIVIDLTDAGSSPCLKIAQEDLLCSLKTYAQSSPPGEFRTEVYGGTIRRLPKFFHLESITRLEMGVEGHGREKWPPGDTKYIGELKDRIGIEMSRLASLLSELPNLEVFSWRDPNDMILTVGCFPITMLPEEPFSSFPEERKKLQIAFLGMRKLVELKFYNLFFDPSFFVIPPESTRKLVIGIEMSDDWWRQFAKCQMPSIRELEIDIVHPQSHLHPLSSDFTIEDVSVTGLEKVSVICGDEFIPSDLRECVAQRNEAYLPQYIREKARERAGEIMKENAEKLAEHAFYVSRALEAECVTKILAIPDHEDDRRKQEFAQEYASVFMNSFTGTIDLRSFTSARENARSLRAKTNEYFEEIIRRITQEMEDTYTIKFAHGVENNDKCEQEFRSQCQEKLNRWIEMENDASKYDLFNARNLTRELASISERELMSMQGLDMIELLERRNNINDTAIEGIATAIVTNSEEDIERITNEWAQERVQILEYLFCENTVFL